MFDTEDDLRDVRLGDVAANSPMGMLILLQSPKVSDRIYALNLFLKGPHSKKAERKIEQGVEHITVDAMSESREDYWRERVTAMCQFDIFRRGLR